MPLLLHNPWNKRQLPVVESPSFKPFHPSLESWPLASVTSTLLPPFQPPSISPLPGVINHQHLQTHIQHLEQDAALHHLEQDAALHHLHPRHERNLRLNNSPSSIYRLITTINEEEDLKHIGDIHSFEEDRSGLQPSKLESPPISPSFFTKINLHYENLDTRQDNSVAIVRALQLAQHPGRCLTSYYANLGDEMTTFSIAPDSPPDLSESKSSKSSSYHSSSRVSSPDGILSDISNFEDIGLEDDAQSQHNDGFALNRQNIPKQPSLRTTSAISHRQSSAPMASPRDLTTSRRDFPSLRGQVERVVAHRKEDSLSLPRKLSNRGFISPSVPTLPMQRHDGERSRSSSPSPLLHSSTNTSGHLTPLSPGRLSSAVRRGSWQPRKSTKQLEAEYHDSDDELPDDTTLWNVPMSPRPPRERSSSWMSSKSGSPERPSPGPQPIPLAHSVSAPPEAPPFDFASESLPKQRVPPRTSSLYSPPTGPHYQASFRDTRAKSWTLAMSELSEEARTLTEALEYHADDSDRVHEARVQSGHKSSRPSLETSSTRRSKTMVELPPLQKGHIMIDPLPISREKEKFLARTRPSWLPPKDPKEEKRHLKEYQRMMAASLESEKRREAKDISAKSEKDDSRTELNRIWESYVYPDWNESMSEHRTRELWWKGVSPKMRGLVWQRAIGNGLALNEASYTKALERAQVVKLSTLQNDETKRMQQCLHDISLDATTAYPDLNLFQRGGPMHDALVDILSAYAMYRSDVGYTCGLHLIASLLLLQISSPAEAFILLANCLNRPLPLAFLTSDATAAFRNYALAQETLSYKFPRLHQLLFGSPDDQGLGLQPEEIFEPMFATLLANGLEVERLARVWDCWVFEGDRTFVRAIVAVLGCLEGQLTMVEGQDVDEKRRKVKSLLGWGPWGRKAGVWNFRGEDGGDENGFMRKVREAGRID